MEVAYQEQAIYGKVDITLYKAPTSLFTSLSRSFISPITHVRWVGDNSLVADGYTNWYPGNPTGGDYWNCMYMSESSGGVWEDAYCDNLNFAVCSKPICTKPFPWLC